MTGSHHGCHPATGPVGGVLGRDILLTSSAPRWPSATPKTAIPSSDLAVLSSHNTLANTEAAQGPALGHPSATLSLDFGEALIKVLSAPNLHRKAVDYITTTEKEPLVLRPGAPCCKQNMYRD